MTLQMVIEFDGTQRLLVRSEGDGRANVEQRLDLTGDIQSRAARRHVQARDETDVALIRGRWFLNRGLILFYVSRRR